MTALSRALRALTAPLAALVVLAAPSSVPAASAESGARPPGFVALADVDPTILQEMRYRGVHNFTGHRVHGYRRPVCLLTRPAAVALHRAQRALLRRGYTLKVYDCYRPQRAVNDFVAWAKDLGDERMKGSSTRGWRSPGCSRTGTSPRSRGTAGAAPWT
ncbi:M15 family metallopeptidase [Streptomyces stramineus]